jgi:quinol monooxygenase YgiN
MIGLTVDAIVSPDKQEEFRQAMVSLFGGSDKQEGIKKSVLYRKASDKNDFILICEWNTKEHLKLFLEAAEFCVLLGAIRVLCKESEIRYLSASGLEAEFAAVDQKP